MNLLAAHAGHFEFQAAIVEEQDVAIDDILGQVLVIEADTFLVAERALGVEDEFFAGHEGDPACLEFADANLRPLQVAQDADRAPELGCRRANPLGTRPMIVGRAMREIHAHDVDAGLHHAVQNFRRGGGGAQRGNDLGMAGHVFSIPACYLVFNVIVGQPNHASAGPDLLYLAARSSRMAMAGRVLPSRNSRKAPPPVEM